MPLSLRHPASRLFTAIARLLGGEAGAGLLLIAVAAIALVLANSPAAHGYHALFHDPLGWSPVPRLGTLHAWINDGLMAVFFFAIGLELKREVLAGQLADPAQRRLPVLAALAGMAMPALIYLAAVRDHPALHAGWAIPAATDIAFAVGVLALVGKRAPPSLRLFLLTVAIVDDLGAVIVIAVAYTAALSWGWLAAAGAVLAALALANRRGVTGGWVYALGAVAAWYAMLHSGVHATIAGVAAALCVPLRLDGRGDSPLLRMEHALAPVSAYLIVPLFGLANAGVALGGSTAGAHTLPLAIALGLVLGKQAGVLGAVALARATGWAALPAGSSPAQLWGVALLCGIGFTMSLFIAQLAWPAAPALVEAAKLGILGGSLASALAGYIVLRLAR